MKEKLFDLLLVAKLAACRFLGLSLAALPQLAARSLWLGAPDKPFTILTWGCAIPLKLLDTNFLMLAICYIPNFDPTGSAASTLVVLVRSWACPACGNYS